MFMMHGLRIRCKRRLRNFLTIIDTKPGTNNREPVSKKGTEGPAVIMLGSPVISRLDKIEKWSDDPIGGDHYLNQIMGPRNLFPRAASNQSR